MDLECLAWETVLSVATGDIMIYEYLSNRSVTTTTAAKRGRDRDVMQSGAPSFWRDDKRRRNETFTQRSHPSQPVSGPRTSWAKLVSL